MDQRRKANFLEDELTAMVEEIEDRQHVLFGGLNSGLTNKAKQVAWECVAAAVNEVGQQDRTVADLKKKWSDLKLQGKKRIVIHNRSIKATGGGPGTPELSQMDQRVAAIIGESAYTGTCSDGDSECFKKAVTPATVKSARETPTTASLDHGQLRCSPCVLHPGMKSVRPRFPSVTDPQVPGVRGKVRPQLSRVHPRLRPRLRVAC
ncbi:hypothetical protein SKAU_G00391750 [Synaphobranchus kaupii]|uniref:Myb/SANT-like DNA-binding domain-containing protein n=1 Tax=Synaphobranchus kaupii TaxID=118154 RepID=A0A9Q1IBN6_SYNKA|nr:hypothetical protein SKAU_G00391750 [Synaphobranchus kaupii]